uniref:Uncharacterized protein n=1 Tax=Tanacetum cinerariifolium TaxID=118510 RepID=A0A699GHZ3_TANCI|nr:hypothetical protein [Tanacetum cinerariifolium]
MSTQQDIYVVGSENSPPMLNKDNYVPWSSRLIHYVKSKPNGKLIYNSIMNGRYVKRMIPEPSDPDCKVTVTETFHEQTDDELTEKEVKQLEADDQAIQIILMGLFEDIYTAVDSWIANQNLNSNRNVNVVATLAEGNAIGNNEIKEVNANCILMANLQQASTSGTQTDSVPVYDSDGSAEVKMNDPNITMEEYIRLEEEKACRRSKLYDWETATYGNICVIYPDDLKSSKDNDDDNIAIKQLSEDNTDVDDEERSNSLEDNIISGLPPCFAITPNEPVLSTEEPDNSLSMGDEHLDTILATESDEVIKSSVENLIPIPSESEGILEHMCDVPFHDNSPPLDVSKDQFEDFSESNDEFSSIDDYSFSIDNIDYVEASPPDSELFSSEVMEIVIPEVGGIDDDILLTIKDDILREKLLNSNLLIAKIKALNDNLTPSSNCKTKSSSTSLNSLLEETNTFDNSLPEFETFCFDVEEINSGSTTTNSGISLPEYEVFHDDHVKEISSGSPTNHFDFSLYASFIFDLSINPFPPADRSDFYESADELIPFISPPEYDCFLFKVEPNSRDFTKDMVEDISPTKEPQVHNALLTHPTFQLNMKLEPSSESLFTYVVWIFLPFLVYSVAPRYLLSLRNEDTIFDPGICNYHSF